MNPLQQIVMIGLLIIAGFGLGSSFLYMRSNASLKAQLQITYTEASVCAQRAKRLEGAIKDHAKVNGMSDSDLRNVPAEWMLPRLD